MKDDRCGDGALMQIDQCLCCTRFEPIFGQTYEITRVLTFLLLKREKFNILNSRLRSKT